MTWSLPSVGSIPSWVLNAVVKHHLKLFLRYKGWQRKIEEGFQYNTNLLHPLSISPTNLVKSSCVSQTTLNNRTLWLPHWKSNCHDMIFVISRLNSRVQNAVVKHHLKLFLRYKGWQRKIEAGFQYNTNLLHPLSIRPTSLMKSSCVSQTTLNNRRTLWLPHGESNCHDMIFVISRLNSKLSPECGSEAPS